MCSAEEEREVERMAVEHPQVKQELSDIENSLIAYAGAHAKPPSPALRDRILSHPELSHEPQHPLKVVYKAESKPASTVKPWYRLVAAASITLLAISTITNILLYTKYRKANEQVLALNNEKNVIAENASREINAVNERMNLLADPSVEQVQLKGLPTSPGSLAMVYWNHETGVVMLDLKNVPMPVAGKQYQLWAIVEGKPVDAGMITVEEGDTSLHRMKDLASAQAFAITLENEGGSAEPTLDQMIVLGQVSL
jgi:anti-sigma-K factor RskA